MGFPCGSAGKESTCSEGDLGSIPGLGRSSREGKRYPLQCSGLENSMDYTVHGVAKSQTWVSDFHFHFCVKCSLGISNFLEEKILIFPISAKSLQLCPTLCEPIDGSPPGAAVPGILQARALEWVAISFSNAWDTLKARSVTVTSTGQTKLRLLQQEVWHVTVLKWT